MQTRATRYSLVALLLVVGIGAASFAWYTNGRLDAAGKIERDIITSIDRLSTSAAGIAADEAAYVVPGQPNAPRFERVEGLTQQMTADMAAIGTKARSSADAAALQMLADSMMALQDADARARDHLRSGQDQLAADLVFGVARDTLTDIDTALRDLRAGEELAFANERAGAMRQVTASIGGAAILWVIGLLMLVRVPASSALVADAPAAPQSVPAEPSPLEPAGDDAAQLPGLDLAAAADLCTELSRLSSANALPDMLARAAALLDAPGIIVWLGSGEELFAATAHGYDPRVIGRLGPIDRTAENATASAWRTGEIKTVSGDRMSNGAIVAPMFGPDTCIGVLAAEVRHGREDDSATRAVTSMIAAQLATIVSTWSTADPAPHATEA